MFKILFARLAFFKAISKYWKSIERPTEKRIQRKLTKTVFGSSLKTLDHQAAGPNAWTARWQKFGK
jgi:hypothetical protein